MVWQLSVEQFVITRSLPLIFYTLTLSLSLSLSLSYNTITSDRAREALRTCLPEQLKENIFANTLKDDSTTKKWLSQLLQNLGVSNSSTTAPQPVESGEAQPTVSIAAATTSAPA